MANEVVNRRLNIFIDDGAAEASLRKLSVTAEKLVKDIDKGTKAGKDMSTELKRLDKVKGQMQDLGDQIDGKTRPAFSRVKAVVTQLSKELSQMSEDAPGYAAKFEKFRNATAEFDRMKQNLGGIRGALKKVGADLKTFALGSFIGGGVQSVLSGIQNGIGKLFTGSGKVSDELADIEKSSGLSADAVRKLNDELTKIDTRTTDSQLREIAVGLGQVGEAANKVNVQAIDQIVVALGDEFGGGAKEITTQLSILRNNLQDIKTKNYGDDVSKLGNALNVLGAEGLATAPVVTDIANRVAGVAGTFKVSSGAILGTAATFQELGIAVERGSTAYIKILQKITAEPEKFATVSGKSIKEFTKLVNTDLQAAFVAVATGAKKAGTDNVAFGKILKDLDADGSGAGEVLSKIAVNAELLATKTRVATAALKDNSSIVDEFNKKNNTLGAELDKLGKRMASVFNNSSLSALLTDLTRGANNLLKPTKSLTESFQEQKIAVNKLESETLPLINKFDELSKKANELGGTSKLSKEEQENLNTAIQTISSTIPGAITQFDQYGKAIAINSEVARGFIRLQQQILKERNRSAILDLEDEAKDVQARLGLSKQNLFKLQQGRDNDFKKYGDKVLKFYNENLPSAIQKVTDAEARLAGIRGLIAELSGKETDEQKRLREEIEKGKNTPTITPPENPLVIVNADEMKRQQKALEDLRLELKKISHEFDLDELSKYQRKIAEINDRFDELVDKAKGNEGLTQQAQNLRERALGKALDDLQKSGVRIPATVDLPGLEESIKNASEKIKEIGDKGIKQFFENQERGKYEQEIAARNKFAAAELKLLQSSGKERLKAQKELLELERIAKIESTQATGVEIDLINEQFRQQEIELDKQYVISRVETFLEFVSQVSSIFSTLSQIRSNESEAELQRDREYNDRKKDNYKSLLDEKLISQKNYDKKIAEIDKEQSDRERKAKKEQFKRDQTASIVQAGINGAMGVTKTISEWGFPLAIPFIALAVAATAAQILAIKSKEPSFGSGTGAFLEGPSHQSRHKGMPVKNPETGQTVAYMEGGEGVTNKRTMKDPNRYQVEGTPSQIISGLNSMHGGVSWHSGASIRPKWASSKTKHINVSGINNSMQKVGYYAAGGVFNGAGASGTKHTAGQNITVQAVMSDEQMVLFSRLETLLSSPLFAYVVYGDYEAKANRINNIRDNGTIS